MTDATVIQDEPVLVIHVSDRGDKNYELQAWTYNGCDAVKHSGYDDTFVEQLSVATIQRTKLDEDVKIIDIDYPQIGDRHSIECFFSGGYALYTTPPHAQLIYKPDPRNAGIYAYRREFNKKICFALYKTIKSKDTDLNKIRSYKIANGDGSSSPTVSRIGCDTLTIDNGFCK